MSAPKKPPAAGPIKTAFAPVAGKPSVFALTADEMAYAVRYFAALRRMERGMADEAQDVYLLAIEQLADEHPLHAAPRLRLVAGGAA